MSSPIHHAKDLDAALMYAPPWAREQGTRKPFRPSQALARGQQRRRPIALSTYEYSGDRDMMRLQRQLALDPERTPEPPTQSVQSLLPMVGRLCGVGCVAAAAAWFVLSVPSARLLRGEATSVAASASQSEIAAPKSDPLRTEAGAGLLLQHGLAAATPAPPPADNRSRYAVTIAGATPCRNDTGNARAAGSRAAERQSFRSGEQAHSARQRRGCDFAQARQGKR